MPLFKEGDTVIRNRSGNFGTMKVGDQAVVHSCDEFNALRINTDSRYSYDATAYDIVATDQPSQPQPTVDIGVAIYWAKRGRKFSRKGWNGANQCVYYVPAASYPAQRNLNGTWLKEDEEVMVEYNHYLAIKHPDGTVSTWSPSCSDALATDYILLD